MDKICIGSLYILGSDLVFDTLGSSQKIFHHMPIGSLFIILDCEGIDCAKILTTDGVIGWAFLYADYRKYND